MKLYKKLKRVRSIELCCDPHYIPMEHNTAWVDDDTISDENLIKNTREQYGENFQYILQEKFIPYEEPQEPKWIPVSERLPEEGKTVMASTEYGVYPEARYTKEYGWEWAYEAGADYWRELGFVTAWMSLPEHYKEKED